jgi:hypothetical protein
MRKVLSLALLLCSLFVCSLIPASAATTVYVAATAGVVTGGTLCNGQPAITIGSIIWTAGTTYVFCGTFTASAGAGGYVTVGASGFSGSPITIEFDTTTVIQAPYWGTNGAIDFNNESYVILNCNGNGTVQTTANGSGLTYQQPAYGAVVQYPLIHMGTGSNNTLENCPALGPNYVHVGSILVTGASGNGTTATLTLASTCPYAVGNTVWIQGINPTSYNASDVTVTACSGNTISYANTTTASYVSGGFLTDENGFGAYSVMVNISGSVSATNITITNNTIHDCHFCIYGGATAGQTLSNVTVTNNTFYNMDHGVAWFDNNDGLSTWNGTNIFAGNTYYDWANWDDQIAGDNGLDVFHHDGIHMGAQYGVAGLQSVFSGFYVYNNYFYGNPGQGMTAELYLFGTCVVGSEGCLIAPQVFNNVFVNGSPGCVATPANSLFLNWNEGATIENNTFVGCSTSASLAGNVGVDEYTSTAATGSTYYNNIFDDFNIAIYMPNGGGLIAAANNNDYYSVANVGKNNTGNYYSTLSAWQGCTSGGCPASHDGSSTSGNPLLTSAYQLTSGASAAWQAGTNLYSICNGQPNPGLGALCFDVSGVTRPSTGPWDTGAFQFPGIYSPVNGSALTGTSATFQWGRYAGASAYWLDIGSTQGGNNYYSSGSLSNSTFSLVVGTLPSDGSTVYATWYYLLNGTWTPTYYSYRALGGSSGQSAITSPVPSSTLSGSSVAFTWTAGAGALAYWLDVGGTAGGNNYYSSGNLGNVLTQTVNGLPTNGSAVYVTLYSLVGVVWLSNAYSYTAFNASGAGVITSPANGSTLCGNSVTFHWTAGAGASAYWLDVGSTAGGNNYYSSGNLGNVLTTTAGGLPTDGSTIYVTLYSLISGVWSGNAYTYTAFAGASEAGVITSPANGSTLSGSSVAFNWTAGAGASAYWLDVGGTAGGNNYYSSGNLGNVLTTTASGLPTDGSTIYVTLYSLISGVWSGNAYTYTAFIGASGAGVITSPANGSTLSGSSVAFNWTAGAGASAYWLDVGGTAGGNNYYSSGNLGNVLTTTASGLPTDGSTIYVTLYSLISGVWSGNAYTYTALTVTGGLAAMTSPVPGTTLSGTTVTFTWSDSSATAYWVDIGSTAGGNDVYSSGNLGTAMTTTVSTLPANGNTIYVSLYSYVGGQWLNNPVTYISGP